MTFANWYSSKYPFIASEEEFALLQDVWEVATKEEREACARVCLDMQMGWCSDDHLACADAIRKRSDV